MSTVAAHLSRPVTGHRTALAAAAALAVVAVVHLVDGPPGLEESYSIGALELALAAAVVPIAVALVICPVRDVWIAAVALNAVALGLYVVSRTVGLGGMTDDIGDWFSMLGVLNVLSEVAVIALAAFALSRRTHQTLP